MRKSVRIEFDTDNWKKLKTKAIENDSTLENEANIMLKNYVNPNL